MSTQLNKEANLGKIQACFSSLHEGWKSQATICTQMTARGASGKKKKRKWPQNSDSGHQRPQASTSH